MTGYFTKLDTGITDSTVWREPDTTRLVWITLLAMADQDGYIGASVPGLADRARVPLDSCLVALECFRSPDKWSRSQEFDGRRIADVDGGWVLLNHAKYRAMRDAETRRGQVREAVSRFRAKGKADVSHSKPDVINVSHGKPVKAQADTDTEAYKAKAKKEPVRGSRLPTDWNPSAELLAWAKDTRPDLFLDTENAAFLDYWIGVAGAKGVKLDWDATYRNWIRRATGGMRRAAADSAPSKARQKINNLQERINGLVEARDCQRLPAPDLPMLGPPADG